MEIRGTAEAQTEVDPPEEGLSREVIRITPRWIGIWNISPDQQGFHSQGAQAATAGNAVERADEASAG